MPLIKREVEPVLVSRVDIGREISNELECVTNFTLASIIRQLSNLGKHAEDIFGELYREAMGLSHRANTLQDRIDKLSDKVTKLDATRDQVSLQDIHMRKAFKSSLALDTEVVSSPTMPSAMRETYMRCEKPPKLSLLNQFREDGKDGLKFYTDPKFFFERWCNEQRKDIENNIRKRKRKRKKPAAEKGQQPKVPVNTRKARYQMYAGGVEFADKRPSQSISNSHVSSNEIDHDQNKPRITHSDSIISSTPSDDSGINGQTQRKKASHGPPAQGPPPPPPASQQPLPGQQPMNGDVVLRPVRPAPARPASQQQQPAAQIPYNMPPPPPDVPHHNSLSSATSGHSSIASNDLPPPPPPPQPMAVNNQVPAPPPPPVSAQPLPNNIPPPPPPPPLGGPAAPPPPPIGGIQNKAPAQNNVPIPPPPPGPAPSFQLPAAPQTPSLNSETPAVNSPNRPPPVQASDPRSDLLAAIKEGMKLRKVEVQEEKQRHSEPAPNSVEAILRRRIAVELSSDEEDSQVSSDYEAEWSDED
ncbi:uncharacterized protein [Diadema setosum]|uniref:uncharacterized protein n=1 Tax=Diadema setosum TaxID=31175 RepID=UPI003B3B077D